jgi:UDP-N-acetylglucosamine enolpyruvyl transferase
VPCCMSLLHQAFNRHWQGRYLVLAACRALGSQRLTSGQGAALLVATLAAQGHAVIDSAQPLRLGYEDLPRRLRSVGADISDYLDGR